MNDLSSSVLDGDDSQGYVGGWDLRQGPSGNHGGCDYYSAVPSGNDYILSELRFLPQTTCVGKFNGSSWNCKDSTGRSYSFFEKRFMSDWKLNSYHPFIYMSGYGYVWTAIMTERMGSYYGGVNVSEDPSVVGLHSFSVSIANPSSPSPSPSPTPIINPCPGVQSWKMLAPNEAIWGGDYYIPEIDEEHFGATVLVVSLHADLNTTIAYAQNLCAGPHSPFDAFSINPTQTGITMKNTRSSDTKITSSPGWVSYLRVCTNRSIS